MIRSLPLALALTRTLALPTPPLLPPPCPCPSLARHPTDHRPRGITPFLPSPLSLFPQVP